MRVIINRWLGNTWENDRHCDRCQKHASIVEVVFCVHLCAQCLNEAQTAISEAIMDEVGK
jgi:hypothetical protein